MTEIVLNMTGCKDEDDAEDESNKWPYYCMDCLSLCFISSENLLNSMQMVVLGLILNLM